MASPQSGSRQAGWLGPFLLLNTLSLLVISSRYLLVGGAPETTTAWVFCLFMALGHLGTLVLLALLPAFLLNAIFPRLATTAAVVSMVMLTMFLITDTFVFQLYRMHINRPMMEMIFGDAAREIFVFSNTIYAKIFGLIALVTVLEALAAVQLRRRYGRRPPQRGLRALFCLVLVIHHLVYAFADARSYVPITQQARLLPVYFPTTLRSAFRALGFSRSDSTIDLLESSADFTTALRYPHEPLRCEAPKLNVLFVVLDSWRSDMLTPEIAPNLSRFADSALRFENHSSGGNATRTGIFTLFYGLPADYWHPFQREREGPLLVDEFLRAGYQPAIFASAPLTSPEFHQTVFRQIPNLRLRSQSEKSWERDEEITREFLRFLETRNTAQPFFGFLFYDAPHAFSLPRDEQRIFVPTLDEPDFMALNPSYDPVPFFNLYKNTIHFDDRLIAEVLAKLEQLGLRDNTIVILTGDHGQEFNENGKNYWGHSGNFTRYQIGVPLAIRWPGHQAGRVAYATNHIDIAPTLLHDLFRCGNPLSDYSLGENLFEPSKRKFFLLGNYEEQALVQPDRLTLIHAYGGIEEVDPELNRLPDQHHDADMLRSFLSMQSAFLKP